MEVYILDSLYRRTAVIDSFQDLIWTERFSAAGDFELHLISTFPNRNQFRAGTNLALSSSDRVMTVQTVEDDTDASGVRVLKITGKSLEYILDDRLARGTLGDLTTTPKWVLTGTPMAIANQIFHDICVTGILDAGDIIAGITEASIYPADTIPADTDTYEIDLDPMSVYSALVQICSQFGMGFRIVRDGDTAQLYFDVYMGSDRTTGQTTLDAVVFAPDLDNLQDTSELTSIATWKNVAYVISAVGSQLVYDTDVDPSVAGFDRRVLLVKADDIKDSDPVVATAQMIQKGRDELAKYRQFSAFDGQIPENGAYRYGRDYNLGDLVVVRNSDGVTNYMRVTEQIFVSDKEGERSYPTLTLNDFITPGSWLAEPTDLEWIDLDLDPQTWADQP